MASLNFLFVATSFKLGKKNPMNQWKLVLALQLVLMCWVPILNGSPFKLFSSGQTSLYGPEDKVYILNATNIHDHIYNSDQAWFVEFFSSWCGHCINFAPKWKQFAIDLYDWRNVVIVAGIDCADEANTATCRDHEIMGYPSLMMYPPHSPMMIEALEQEKAQGTFETLNKGVRVQKAETMEKLKRSLMDSLEIYFPKLLKFHEPDDPSSSTLWDVNDGFHYGKPKFVLVIYESDSSYIGKEIVLKLSLTRDIKVYRFKRKNRLYSKLGLEGWPAVGYLKEDGSIGALQLGSNQNLIEYIYSNTYALAGIEMPKQEQNYKASLGSNEPKGYVHVPNPNRDVVSMDDILHAIRDSLHKEIALIKTISDRKLIVLRQYLSLLIKLLPFDRREVKVFLEKLSEWVSSKSEVQSTEFLEQLEELENELHPWDIDLSSWDECSGTVSGRRGYTCGLWRMFHTLTMIGIQKGVDERVLEVMHGYVTEFFGCRECSEHFHGMVMRDGILGTNSIKEQALWLWKRHNEVNMRLKGAPSEDPGFPKEKYPSKRLCRDCYDAETDELDDEKTLAYLLHVYTHPKRSEKNVISRESQRGSPHFSKLVNEPAGKYHQPVDKSFKSSANRFQRLLPPRWLRYMRFQPFAVPYINVRNIKQPGCNGNRLKRNMKPSC